MTEFYDSCEGLNLWLNLILTLIISPSLLVIKILWDRCRNRRKETLLMNNKLHLEKISLKLQYFYWPIYIRLVKNYNIWVRFLEHINNEDDENSIDSDSDDGNNIDQCKCIYIKNQRRCDRPIHKNSDKNMCLKHVILLNKTIICNKYDDSLYKYFKIQLLENYKDINKLIIDYIYIAEPNTKLGKLLIYYMKFSIVMIGLIETNNKIDLERFNLKYPQRLLPMIETKLFKLQKNYNVLLRNFYYTKK